MSYKHILPEWLKWALILLLLLLGSACLISSLYELVMRNVNNSVRIEINSHRIDCLEESLKAANNIPSGIVYFDPKYAKAL